MSLTQPKATAIGRIRPAWRRPTAAALAGLVLFSSAPARAADLRWRGLLDLVAAEHSTAFDYNVLTRGDGAFDPYRLRLFAESQAGERVQVLGQVVLDDASGIYVDGAYVIFTPWPERDLRLLAGKLPWAVGTWGPRGYSSKNPLIGVPLLYQYHSTLLWYGVPPDADALLATAGSGQQGVDYFGFPMGVGMPIVDDAYWDVGVTLAGSQRPFEYALGVVAGAPGWGSTSKDDNSGKSVLGRLGVTPIPQVRVGVSGSFGPYLHQSLNPSLPPGRDVNDYAQKLAMADLEVMVGRVELRAEGAHNVWETPTVGDLEVDAGYAELKVATSSGLFVAGRWDVERFGEIRDSGGIERPWDWNVTRLEAGVGYRITRDAAAKIVVQRTRLDTRAATDRYRDLSIVGAQLSLGF